MAGVTAIEDGNPCLRGDILCLNSHEIEEASEHMAEDEERDDGVEDVECG